MTPGRPREAVLRLAGYRPGKAASQAEEEHGIDNAIKLASNENPYSPVPAVAQAMADAIAGVNRYGDNNATDVRAALSEWIGVDADHLTVGCGSSGILQQLFFAYVDAGDDVVFPWPSFEIYPVFSTLFDANAIQVPLADHAFDMGAVAAAVTESTKIIFLATPNNPTGTSTSMDAVAELLAQVPNDTLVVIDEAYREFNDPAFGDPVDLLKAGHRNLVITRTFSKAYGLAGLRTGYAIADPAVVAELDKVRLAFSVNNIAQAATVAAIEHRDAAMEKVAGLTAERERCHGALADAGWDLPPAHANFVWIPTEARTEEIYLAMEKVGVVTRPFPGVGLRVTVSTPEENDRWLAAFLAATS
jgi:histidinol-phosphate aminotransferase